jgi:eukaryotic-like serine/threonine-protein kinase
VPDFVKVLDFGLVKIDRRREPGDPRLTADAGITGTPAFIAPEAVLGDRPTDHRVDLYSVGCVAYWLLTGKLVFEAESTMKMMIDHVHAPPAPPSTRVDQAIPPALEELVLACLEKAPEGRPASADELADRLQSISLPAWTKERAERWWNAHGGELPRPRAIADVLLSHEQRPRAGLAPPRTRA